MKRLATRLLVCSPEIPPPQPTAHSIVMARLFHDIDPADYCIAGFGPVREAAPDQALLPAKTYRIPSGWMPTINVRPDYPLRHVRALRLFTTEVTRRARQLAELIHAEDCGAILATTSQNTVDVPASYLAARMTGVPLFIYMLDNWQYMLRFYDPVLAPAARRIQSAMLAGARGVFTQNAHLADEVKRENGRDCTVVGIGLPVDIDLEVSTSGPWPSTPGELRIVFTGQVYTAHFDAIARVLEALESPRLQNASLHIYGATSEDYIRNNGLTGRMQIHGHITGDVLHEVQRRADILLLPLAFETPIPEIVRAAAPTKTGEYLATGRPILIHAPPDSYLAQLAREDEVAALVDQPDAGAVEDAILRIASDDAFRARITSNAQATARRLYSNDATTGRFVSTFNELVGARPRA